ncbi:N-carbamoyl-L-amino-acid hydrolase [Pseudocercospora fuligena]|uniref:N-carbamoyl-L-amino-acid hydrolase n=1 Tax=Pseudocercospora fuligena TaxID=685502 RepID=A0A8H6RWY4_9PEZI|nr:N-carbamoyl-L-amino-acid hydrolase [Pseudocercospora fuligena]
MLALRPAKSCCIGIGRNTCRGYSSLTSTQAQKFTINGDRLWNDIHNTAQWSAPNATTEAGGLSRLSGTSYDKKARDWFRDQVKALGAETYTVNATGSQFATFPGKGEVPPIAMGSHLDSVATGGRFDGPLGVLGALEVVRSMKEQAIETFAPITLINWTNEEGARFFPPLGSSCVYAGQSSVNAAHESKANDGGSDTLGAALASIGYVGSGPNTFQEFPISAHFEIHVEQQTTLEAAGKPVGWVEGWQGISVLEMTFHGEDGHANTYPMERRKDSLVTAAKTIADIEDLPSTHGGFTTVTSILSGPVGCCNIQSWTKIVFCLMHPDSGKLAAMNQDVEARAVSRAAAAKVKLDNARIMHSEPGKFWPEAVECVKRACGDKGIGADTLTAHDSTMTTLVCPTAMVFARAKDGVSHAAKEWTSKEDCAESALVLGKSVLEFDYLLQHDMTADAFSQ